MAMETSWKILHRPKVSSKPSIELLHSSYPARTTCTARIATPSASWSAHQRPSPQGTPSRSVCRWRWPGPPHFSTRHRWRLFGTGMVLNKKGWDPSGKMNIDHHRPWKSPCLFRGNSSSKLYLYLDIPGRVYGYWLVNDEKTPWIGFLNGFDSRIEKGWTSRQYLGLSHVWPSLSIPQEFSISPVRTHEKQVQVWGDPGIWRLRDEWYTVYIWKILNHMEVSILIGVPPVIIHL